MPPFQAKRLKGYGRPIQRYKIEWEARARNTFVHYKKMTPREAVLTRAIRAVEELMTTRQRGGKLLCLATQHAHILELHWDRRQILYRKINLDVECWTVVGLEWERKWVLSMDSWKEMANLYGHL